MAKGPVTRESIKSFAAEYRALCLKHGLRITFDNGFRSSEVMELDENDLADDEWELFPFPWPEDWED